MASFKMSDKIIKNMKIALISFHSFLQPGGVKRHILGLAKEFKRRGIKVKIIVPRRNWRENYGKDVILSGTSFPINFGGGRSDFGINFNPISIERTLRKEKFDVLHLHNVGFPSTFQILASPFAANTLNILTFHSNIKGSRFLKNFPTLIYILNKICQWKINGVIGVAPLSLKVFKNYSGPKIVIPNGIDLEEFNPRVPKIKKFADGKINILFVGRIEKRKGLIYLLRAYRLLQKKDGVRLIIVGEGPFKERCQKYVRENHLKEVHFEGKVTEKIPSYYRSADIFVSPAIFGESFGIVLLEAMASGVPVVAFSNEGYQEILRGKKGCFSVKPRDFRALSQKIEILVKNPDLRRKMGRWNEKDAQKYSWSKVASEILDFYKSCKKRKPKNSFTLDKILNLLYKKDILSWLKQKKYLRKLIEGFNIKPR